MYESAQIVAVLEQILAEIVGLRSDFTEFTNYNVYNMKTTTEDLTKALEDLTKAVTGPTGYHLEDIFNKLGSIESVLDAIDMNTSS